MLSIGNENVQITASLSIKFFEASNIKYRLCGIVYHVVSLHSKLIEQNYEHLLLWWITTIESVATSDGATHPPAMVHTACTWMCNLGWWGGTSAWGVCFFPTGFFNATQGPQGYLEVVDEGSRGKERGWRLSSQSPTHKYPRTQSSPSSPGPLRTTYSTPSWHSWSGDVLGMGMGPDFEFLLFYFSAFSAYLSWQSRFSPF